MTPPLGALVAYGAAIGAGCAAALWLLDALAALAVWCARRWAR